MKKGFSQGGYVEPQKYKHAGVASPAEHYLDGKKLTKEEYASLFDINHKKEGVISIDILNRLSRSNNIDK